MIQIFRLFFRHIVDVTLKLINIVFRKIVRELVIYNQYGSKYLHVYAVTNNSFHYHCHKKKRTIFSLVLRSLLKNVLISPHVGSVER